MSAKHHEKFVDFLVSLKENHNRAALATLRRGLGKPLETTYCMHPYIMEWVGNLHPEKRKMYYLVASLFAYYPEHTEDQVNGGDICRQIANARSSGTMDKRFIVLLDSDERTFAKHLQTMVGLAKSSGIKINWKRLLSDLCYWTHKDGTVKFNWSKSYWIK